MQIKLAITLIVSTPIAIAEEYAVAIPLHTKHIFDRDVVYPYITLIMRLYISRRMKYKYIRVINSVIKLNKAELYITMVSLFRSLINHMADMSKIAQYRYFPNWRFQRCDMKYNMTRKRRIYIYA